MDLSQRLDRFGNHLNAVALAVGGAMARDILDEGLLGQSLLSAVDELFDEFSTLRTDILTEFQKAGQNKFATT